MSALSFCFESNTVRILGDALTPLFVAIDICKALGHSNPRQALRDCVDPEDLCKEFVETKGGRQEVNCVNESGMYALIFGSKLPSAKRFKRWVTSEVLPSIRKNGAYDVNQPQTITPAQQLAIQQAVAKRAKGTSTHFHTIYRAIKIRFQIAKYDQLPQNQFNECLEFIKTVDLFVPEVQNQEHQSLPVIDESRYLTKNELISLKQIHSLHKDPYFKVAYDVALATLQACNSQYAGRFHDVMKEPALALLIIEKILERNGIEHC